MEQKRLDEIKAYAERIQNFECEARQNDYLLWAEFLTSSDRYKAPFDSYLENFESGNEY